jgi:hypothetical protein
MFDTDVILFIFLVCIVSAYYINRLMKIIKGAKYMSCKKCKGNHFVYKNDNLNTENTRKFVNYETEFCDECQRCR